MKLASQEGHRPGNARTEKLDNLGEVGYHGIEFLGDGRLEEASMTRLGSVVSIFFKTTLATVVALAILSIGYSHASTISLYKMVL